MAELRGCTLRKERRLCCLLAGLGLCSAMACSSGTDITEQVNGNAAAPAAPGEGVLTGNPVPPADVLAGPTLQEPTLQEAEPSSAGVPPAPPANSPPVQAPPEQAPSASGAEPEPNATETNFFGAGCRSNADCGENRRCELPVEAEADAAVGPAPADAGLPDAGADAAVPETLVPRGHCVAL